MSSLFLCSMILRWKVSESISQKLSKVSVWNLEYLDDPVICISRVICPCFGIVHRNLGYCFSIIKIFSITIKAINLKFNTLVESVDPNLLTREDNSIQHFIWVIRPFWLGFKKYNFSIIIIGIEMKLNIPVHYQMGNPLQQGRWPCDLYIQSYLPLFRHST